MKFNLDNEVLFHSMSQLRTRSVCCNLFITDVNYYNKFRRLIWFQNLTKLIQHSDKEKNIYMKILTSFNCYLAKNAPEFFSIDINEWYVLKWVCRACNWLHMYISVDWILVSVTGFFYLRGFKVNQAHNSAWFKSKWKLKSIVMLELASDILEKLTLIQNR